jgi:hypothetical protein
VVYWSEFLATDPEVRVPFPSLPGFLRRSWSGTGSGLEIREYGRRDPSRWPRGTLYQQKLALTSLTSGTRSACIVRSRTEATEFVAFLCSCVNVHSVIVHEEVQKCLQSIGSVVYLDEIKNYPTLRCPPSGAMSGSLSQWGAVHLTRFLNWS